MKASFGLFRWQLVFFLKKHCVVCSTSSTLEKGEYRLCQKKIDNEISIPRKEFKYNPRSSLFHFKGNEIVFNFIDEKLRYNHLTEDVKYHVGHFHPSLVTNTNPYGNPFGQCVDFRYS